MMDIIVGERVPSSFRRSSRQYALAAHGAAAPRTPRTYEGSVEAASGYSSRAYAATAIQGSPDGDDFASSNEFFARFDNWAHRQGRVGVPSHLHEIAKASPPDQSAPRVL